MRQQKLFSMGEFTDLIREAVEETTAQIKVVGILLLAVAVSLPGNSETGAFRSRISGDRILVATSRRVRNLSFRDVWRRHVKRESRPNR